MGRAASVRKSEGLQGLGASGLIGLRVGRRAATRRPGAAASVTKPTRTPPLAPPPAQPPGASPLAPPLAQPP
eukprot:366052-Chlamydomonas_euryale.AAC.22